MPKPFRDIFLSSRHPSTPSHALFRRLRDNYMVTRLISFVPISIRQYVKSVSLNGDTMRIYFSTKIAQVEFNKFGKHQFLDSIKSLRNMDILNNAALELLAVVDRIQRVEAFIDKSYLNSHNVNPSWLYKKGISKGERIARLRSLANNSFQITYQDVYYEHCRSEFDVSCTDPELVEIFTRIQSAIRRNLSQASEE